MSRNTARVARASAFIVACIGAPAFAADEYSFTLVDAFVTSYDLRECYIFDLSDQNVAVGTATIQVGSNITYSGFYWTADDGKTPAAISWPKGVNNNGLMAGVTGLLQIPSGTFTTVPTLPAAYQPLVLLDVNDAGIAVGYEQTCTCSNSQGTQQVPYVWDAVNGARALPIPGAHGAARINNNGLVVGWTGGWNMSNSYVYDLESESYILMSTLFTGSNVQTTAVDVNDNDVVVGARLNWNGTISHGYTWSAQEGVTLLPLPPAGYQTWLTPASINDEGEVVGRIYTPTGSSRAFLYDAAHGVRDLSTLTTPPPGFTMMTATAINDNGWIAGYGYGGGGMYKSFVLAPIIAAGPTGDATGDGHVDVDDLLAVITAWGACAEAPAACPADVDGDGAVGVNDLVMMITHWQ